MFQPQKNLLPERPEIKPQKPVEKTEVVSSTLASLFAQPEKPRHPWSKDGQFDIGATYGQSGMGGGFLGIRGGMPRMPSFKVCNIVAIFAALVLWPNMVNVLSKISNNFLFLFSMKC